MATITLIGLRTGFNDNLDSIVAYGILITYSVLGLVSYFAMVVSAAQWSVKYGNACKILIMLSIAWYMLAPLVVYIGNAPK